MNVATLKNSSRVIVYDADLFPSADEGLFQVDTWQAKGCVTGAAAGRGTAWFLQTPAGSAVLRQYLRGGLAAKLSHDLYLFTGFPSSRPLREFHLLRSMHEAGLRVPQPLAALCQREGALGYRGALLTKRIEPAQALHDRLSDRSLNWRRIGEQLRQFHAAGMNHADLNARNILLDDRDQSVWLIDLDQSRFTAGKPVDGRRNIARLKRSIDKLWPDAVDRREACWAELIQAYT